MTLKLADAHDDKQRAKHDAIDANVLAFKPRVPPDAPTDEEVNELLDQIAARWRRMPRPFDWWAIGDDLALLMKVDRRLERRGGGKRPPQFRRPPPIMLHSGPPRKGGPFHLWGPLWDA